MGSHRWLTAVSKCQCEIIKNNQGVFLKDRSSNGANKISIILQCNRDVLSGTWVNGHKVGKDSMWPLEHNSDICFAGANKKVFVYMSSESQTDQFPAALTSKYTVSKTLGRGATGEVRLGFRIPDLHRVAIKIICKRTNSTISNKDSSQ